MSDIKIAIVVSMFNEDVTSLLLEGAVSRLKEHNIHPDNITVEKVPGAVEIPLVAKLLAQSKQYAAVICLGAVIRGETTHYDYVCQQVSEGCQKVMLTFDLPIIFGLLTTENIYQAMERVGGHHGHKGKDAADTALSMIAIVDRLKN